MFGFSKDKWPHRRDGDRHRDAREWSAAADAYRRHLMDSPTDAGIWVQLAHAHKEEQLFADAEAAYLRAAELAPRDADPLLHLGHMLKGLGKADEALGVFKRLIRITPDEQAMDQIRQLIPRLKGQAATTAGEGTVLFVVEDFLSAFQSQTTMTGIQRVQAGILSSMLNKNERQSHFIIDGGHPRQACTFLRIEPDDLHDLINYVLGPKVDQSVVSGKLILARLNATPISCNAGSTIVVLGSFWGLGEHPSRYIDIKRAGVRLAAFVHDVIPMTHPEFCDIDFSNAFWRYLADLLLIADFIFTNSEYTKCELDRIVKEYGGRAIPTEVVPLAHSLTSRADTAPTSRANRPKRRPYAAYVSTIEGRKNHIYAVNAWQRMLKAGVKVPDLVFVGRRGWNIGDLDTLLRKTRNLKGRVRIVHGLSDIELEDMYRDAEFTIFTSVVEGWGLPIGESLTLGVPCVASRAASMPEVGGDFVDYIDPNDLDDGIRVLTQMIQNDAYRAERRRRINEAFAPRRWDDVAQDLLHKLAVMIEAHPLTAGPPAPVLLPEGDVFRPGDIMGEASPPAGYFARPMGLALAHSFYEPEPDGAWLRGSSGELRFGVSSSADTVVVLAAVSPAGGGRTFSFDAIAGGNRRPTQPRWTRMEEGENLFRIECPVVDGTVTLLLRCLPEPRPTDDDTRRLGVRLLAIGYAGIDNVPARIHLRTAVPSKKLTS